MKRNEFLDEVNYDQHVLCNKSSTDYNVTSKYCTEKRLLAYDFTFFSKNPKELCNRLRLIIQINKVGKNSAKFYEEVVAIIKKILDYECITTTQHKNLSIKFKLR